MKRIGIIAMVLALVLGLSQCKKEQPTTANEGETVAITLDIQNNGGTRMDVNTGTGEVTYETGDVIYVASGGTFIGTLTHNGTNFGGTITNPTVGEPLHFYFLGNVTPAETLTAGTTTTCSVVISDQTEHLPVIEYAPSNETYSAGATTFTAHLLNKCALVKFNVATLSEATTCITGMKNKVTVSFAENTLTHSQEGNGVITLPAGNGEKWAILLPQEALESGEIGSAYSIDGEYIGTYGEVPTIVDNGFLTNEIAVIVNTTASSIVPTGAINGLFTINANGDQVYFSQGNLQYQASTNNWRFAENQWDYVGTQNPPSGYPVGGTVSGSDNHNISQSYSGWIDLFGWGTSGYNHGAVCYQPWSTSKNASDYYAYGYSSYNLYNQTGKADWGYNSISNGGNTPNIWRTLTKDEYIYVFLSRNTPSGIRYAKAIVNDINGIILLPDNWSEGYYSLNHINQSGVLYNSNVISASIWNNSFLLHGAVFLPAGGRRSGTAVLGVGSSGCYWSASCQSYINAYEMIFNNASFRLHDGDFRDYGQSVRLVLDYQR